MDQPSLGVAGHHCSYTVVPPLVPPSGRPVTTTSTTFSCLESPLRHWSGALSWGGVLLVDKRRSLHDERGRVGSPYFHKDLSLRSHLGP